MVMELARVATDKGSINFSRDLIETLTQLTLQNIKGIIHLKKSGLRKRKELSEENSPNPQGSTGMAQEIRVEIKPDSIIINLFLIIHYGIRIPDLTWEIQAKIKEKLKEQTCLNIDHINVHIQGIRFSKKYGHQEKLVAPGAFLKIF